MAKTASGTDSIPIGAHAIRDQPFAKRPSNLSSSRQPASIVMAPATDLREVVESEVKYVTSDNP